MKRTGNIQKPYSERSDLYILILTAIHNLIFADVRLAGMPLRTLSLLLAGFLCIAVYFYKGELVLPRWKGCSVYEKTMTVLILLSVVALVASALVDSDHFWESVDLTALLLGYLCVCGRKSFPQDIFCVYSASSCVTCILLLCYHLTRGVCEPFVALLLQKDAVVPWLVLGAMMHIIAYCFQERGQIWYGCNLLLTAFLLAIHKNIYGMIIVGIIPLLLPVFCRPSKILAERAAQTELLYLFLICNMSLITGYTPLLQELVTYDLEVSVYMELLLAAAGVWFFHCWDKDPREAGADDTLPQMREWYRKAVIAYLISIAGILAASALFYTDDASAWKAAAQTVIEVFKENSGWKAGLFGQMGQRFGVPGIAVVCVLFYIMIMRIFGAKRWRVKAHKLYRLIVTVCLMQAVFLPQSMVSLPVWVLFIFLFMGTEEDSPGQKSARCGSLDDTTEQGKGENADEADHTDSMLQRGGDFGDRTE